MDLNFTVAAGSNASDLYGVTGIPHSVLIDAQGNVAWQGSPHGLSKGVVKKALKGAKRPKADFLALRHVAEGGSRVSKAVEFAGDGELAAACKEIDAILADEKASEEQKQGAKALQEAVDKHLNALVVQAEKFVKARDPGNALKVLEGIAKELPEAEVGAKTKRRVEEIRADPKMKSELEATKALERLKDLIRPLKRDKSKPKIEEFVKRYEGTRAAERAKFQLQAISSKK